MIKNIPCTDLDEVKSIITNRRKKTNCFSVFRSVLDWVSCGDAEAYVVDNNLFLFHRHEGFYKFYYYVDDFIDIKKSKNILDEFGESSVISLGFATKDGSGLSDLTHSLLPLGFSFYKEYARIITGPSAYESKPEKKGARGYYELASSSDLDEILTILYSHFDIITDELPTRQDLSDLIDDGSVIVRQIEGRIVFIQIYEYSKGVLYSRTTWIEKKFRKPKYVIDFYRGLDEYLSHLDIGENKNLRSYGWVDTANRNFKVNLQSGAVTDGLRCTYFLYSVDKKAVC